jgi:TolB-like protein
MHVVQGHITHFAKYLRAELRVIEDGGSLWAEKVKRVLKEAQDLLKEDK